MKKLIATALILALAIFFIYKNDRKFSSVKKLSEFKKTEFTPTLEHGISNDKNSVYCATLLFAWDEIRKKLGTPLTVSDEHVDLKLLNESTTFNNVLKSDEYIANGEIEGNRIITRAEFNKSLPFETKLENFSNKLVFDGQKVSSFGVTGKNERKQLKIINIRYYENDDNFIVELFLKNHEHEIIFFKSNKSFSSMTDMVSEIDKLIEIGKLERTDEKNNWKYYFQRDDEIIIPKFNFNVETNYPTLEGKQFTAKEQTFDIETAWQRTAFILDEIGAEIKSESFATVRSDGSFMTTGEPKPKKMIFDKPFLIMLKRTETKNPYFGLWVANTELMLKE